MKPCFKLFFLLLPLMLLIACEGEEPAQLPTLGFHGIVELGNESAKVNVEVSNPDGVKITEHGILYGTAPGLTLENGTKISNGSTSSRYSMTTFTIPNLQPDETYYFRGYLVVNGNTIYGSDTRFDSQPVLQGLAFFFPVKAGAGQTLNLRSNNLSFYSSLKVFVGGVEAEIIDKPNDILVKLPAGLPEGYHDVEVDINGKRLKYSEKLLYLGGVWNKKAVFPGGKVFSPATFAIGDFIFAGLGKNDSNKFWKYDTKTNQWTEIAAFPGVARNQTTSFSVGQKGYVMLGSSVTGGTTAEVWEYDMAQDQWTKKNDFTGTYMDGVTAFSYHDNAYVGLGNSGVSYKCVKEFWMYTPGTDSWQKSGITFPGADRGMPNGAFGMLSIFAGGGVTATGGLKDWWEYSFVGQSWIQRPDYPGRGFLRPTTIPFEHFVLRGGGNGEYQEFFLYNIATTEWKEVAGFSQVVDNVFGYYINGKVYMVYAYPGSVIEPAVWEFTYDFE